MADFEPIDGRAAFWQPLREALASIQDVGRPLVTQLERLLHSAFAYAPSPADIVTDNQAQARLYDELATLYDRYEGHFEQDEDTLLARLEEYVMLL